ncbi:hypothetical protein SKAU_G00392430 [Synaphobranchus kaupii]|uniref:Ankyrin repeat domain-containing protein 37 n=1 Tax=Synaphobranchus kaupii TaxID=118154 RepID=A0A9Q1EBW8_SYNKA|nr:hypothetical protein SKAU_G00392430 [Synaphobranchus kaupii]
MFLLDSDSQLDCLSNLLEAGCAVNSTGADANQQDSSGETPIHKAARVGSRECISVLIASDAQLETCNNDGKTAEDLAWSYGYLECAKFLNTLRMNRHLKRSAPAEHVAPETASASGTVVGQKRTCDVGVVRDGKRACDW